MDRFKKANGTCICNELLGCDITTPEGVQYARENGLFKEFCPKMVASAVDILNEIIGEIKPAEKTTDIDWNTTYTIKDGEKEAQYERFPDNGEIEDLNDVIPWTPGTGYKVLQGSGKVRGHVIAVCGGPLWQIMGTKFFPGPDIWEDSIIALEHGSVYGSKLAGLHELRAFAAAGAFDKAKAIITGPLDEDNEETILQVICKEVHRPDMVILENVDYIHRTPMTILPTGALMEIDCDAPGINILESGVL